MDGSNQSLASIGSQSSFHERNGGFTMRDYEEQLTGGQFYHAIRDEIIMVLLF